MCSVRRRGFTLIELLVVIAIIGILAAMLFPVFAKARESARKAHCLSNVKNIAMAVQMYLADWDRFWPTEHEMKAINYFNSAPGGGVPRTLPDICNRAELANPYLREQVMLEEYIKNREIWKCPSARVMNGAKFIIPMGPNGDWVQHYMDHEGDWGSGHWDDSGGPCYPAFPPGWGGDVTDSLTQMRMANVYGYGGDVQGAKVFVSGYGLYNACTDMNLSDVQDPAWFPVVGDCSLQMHFWNANMVAWPDYCKISTCGWGCGEGNCCCHSDWEECEWSQDCGLDWSLYEHFFQDPHFRKGFTRHMGGSNVGFADGHAKFFLAEALMNQAANTGGEFESLEASLP